MTRARRVRLTAAVLVLTALAACGGEEGSGDAGTRGTQPDPADDAIVGTFVGKVPGTDAFVAVVAGPARGGEEDARDVDVYLADGRGLSKWYSGTTSDRTFVAKSADGDAKAEGELTADSVSGTIELPDGRTAEYEATLPSGAAGLYDLTLSDTGELSGVSAAGLAVSGELPPGKPATGVLALVDGSRLEFAVSRERGVDRPHLRAGQVRLILLPDGELRGAGKGTASEGGASFLFLRTAPAPPG
jgi:hypothetical protein